MSVQWLTPGSQQIAGIASGFVVNWKAQPQAIISATEIKELYKLIHALCENLIALESKIEDIDKKLFSVETKLFEDTMTIRDDISKISNQMYSIMAKQNKNEMPKYPKHFG